LLTVLMTTYNGTPTLPQVLQAYCQMKSPAGGWRLLVIDNASTDGSKAVIEGYAARLPLTYLYEGRRGKNAALNSGLRTALADAASPLFVFTDDDASPDPDWLLRLEECAAAHPDYTMFGGAIVPGWAHPPPAWILRHVPLGLTYALTAPDLQDGPVFPGLLWGPNMALRRQVFDAGFRFDETIGPNGGAYAMGSETEMTRRLAAAGYRSWFCPSARVSHYIRAYQLEQGWVLQRAFRFGRGKWLQDAASNGAAGKRGSPEVPTMYGVPRWMLRRFVAEIGGALLAAAALNRQRLFLRRWELHYLAGYFRQAWSAPRRPAQRVLITSYSGELGGMEMRMAQEARVLEGAGYASAVATRRFPGFDGWAAALRGDRIEVRVFDPPPFFEQWRWRRVNKLRAQWFHAPALRRQRPDLVHIAFCWTTYGASALWLAHHCSLPSVISVHNAFPKDSISDWHRPLLAQAFRSVRGIYAVSESAMQHFLAMFKDYVLPHTRLAVIPNSVDIHRFAPSDKGRALARLALRLPEDALVIGCVARLSVQKRPLAVLKLFARLRMEFPNLYLVLVGDGPLAAQLRVQADADGLSGHVLMTGFRRDVECILPAFDLHILLSRNEGFGIATIEAMACGVPAVGTNVPGTSDILQGSHGGVLVPLEDEEAAGDTVAALLADPDRRQRMARCARAEVEAAFSSERLERQVLEFYHGLV
jgi:glycosyltransferase involved in cell wall biosynthesis